MPPNSARLQLGSNNKPDETQELSVHGNNKMIQQLRVETVNCYRSSGSMPIPRPSQVLNTFIKPKKTPKKAEIVLTVLEAAEVYEEINSEEVILISTKHQEPEICSTTSEEPQFAGQRAGKIYQPKILTCEKAEETKDQIRDLPPKNPQPEEQKCRKHSRCHCHLFSLQTSGFFSVAKSNNMGMV